MPVTRKLVEPAAPTASGTPMSGSGVGSAGNRDARPDVVAGFLRAAPRPAPAESGSELRPGLSVVVCTRGRPSSLAQVLESLRGQTLAPAALIVIDASSDAASEKVVADWTAQTDPQIEVRYFRVAGRLRGLTRQRAFGLRNVGTDLMVFFDDDVVLDPGCLGELDRVMRADGAGIVGVGAWIEGSHREVPPLWRMRKRVGAVFSLRPGAYCRTGFSLPWSMQEPTEQVIPAGWLSGCAMAWRTAPAKQVGFSTQFVGYSAGEDLEFSLQMARHGRLVVAGRARVDHRQDPAERPRNFALGYSSALNAYFIHRTCLPDRTWVDGVRFAYAFWADVAMRAAAALLRFETNLEVWRQLGGRFWFLISVHLLRSRRAIPPRLSGWSRRRQLDLGGGMDVPEIEDYPP